MKFSAIVPHLTKRGFVTRKLWKGQVVMFFGMDNSAMRSINPETGKRKELLKNYCWSPNLEEIKATDWIILPYYWNGSKDDFKPFDEKSIVLTHLQETETEKKEIVHDEPVCHSIKKT